MHCIDQLAMYNNYVPEAEKHALLDYCPRPIQSSTACGCARFTPIASVPTHRSSPLGAVPASVRLGPSSTAMANHVNQGFQYRRTGLDTLDTERNPPYNKFDRTSSRSTIQIGRYTTEAPWPPAHCLFANRHCVLIQMQDLMKEL